MSAVIAFRADGDTVEILSQAERIIQKPRGEILVAMIKGHLAPTLRDLIAAGVTPKEFQAPVQRLRKKASNAKDNPS